MLKKIKTFVLENKLALFLVFLPFLSLLLFLEQKTVNTPFWDQWELVPIFEHVNNGQYVFQDFWQQHNEHRLFFPRIIMVFFAVITDWNTRVESFINAGLALSSFMVLLGVLYATSKKLKKQLSAALAFVLALIWFSPLQWENWLWGWQIQWFVSVLGVTIAIAGLAVIANKGVSKKAIAMLVVGAIIAQFSLGNGILVWPVVLLGLVLLQVQKRFIGIVFGSAVLMAALNYFNYEDPEVGASKTYALTHPLQALQYVFTYIGRPLSYDNMAAPLLGLALVCGLLFILYRLWRVDKKHLRIMAPWIALAFYGLASACVTTLSRLGLGTEQSLTSRYTTISSLILVATIVIVFYSWPLLKLKVTKTWAPLAITASLMLTFLIGLNYQWGIDAASKQSQYLKDIQSCTKAEDPYEICLLSTYPNKEIVEPRLDYLKKIHWGGY